MMAPFVSPQGVSESSIGPPSVVVSTPTGGKTGHGYLVRVVVLRDQR